MQKVLITALALTSLGVLTTPAAASKKCRSALSHCIVKSSHCSDKKSCQQDCLDKYNYCTVSHDMGSGKPAEQPEKM
ncbi:hypothetical protein [Methyloceanibacter sp.]|uniref:hypothetical protein n=1 Tax=Methyloceanibacter sp. TaxID=1965321 RepID=UPI002D49080D|nr:hypothetical protein [Methyloceanibacter sp.]HZP08986.1 hypothetical protein [Methyloceanibacter sp.]